MNIIQFLPSLDDGGAETLVKDYALKLKDRGENVVVVTVYNYTVSSNYKILKDAGINVCPLFENYNLLTRVFVKGFGKWAISLRLKWLLKKINPDVIHIHLELLQIIEKVICDFPNVKLCFTCHSKPSIKFSPKFPGELDAAKRLCKSHNLQVIALHDEMRMELNTMLGVKNVKVLHNCVPISRFSKNNHSKKVIRSKLGISDEQILIGHVGRFSKVKNHDFLVDVIYVAIQKKSNIHLLLVGNGSELPSIKEKVEKLGITDKVTFLSHRTDVPDLMKAMDVFVFPSLFEGFPVTLIEIQAVGLPCVASDKVTKEAFVSKNIYSMSIDQTAESWADKVLEIVGDFFYDSKIEAFDIDHIIEELINLYGS